MKHKKLLDNFFNIFDRYPKHYFIFGFFFLFFLIIIFKTFSYTFLNYDFYSDLAYKQQVWKVIVPVNRWTIYSNSENPVVLSTSVNLNDIAVDPTVKWNKPKLSVFLTNIVYKQICYLKSRDDCYNNLTKFLRVLEIEDFSNDEQKIKDLISTKINSKLSQTKVTSVLLEEWLDNERTSKISSLKLPWVYIVSNNLYVNPEEIIDDNFTSLKLYSVIWGNKEQIKKSLRKRTLRYIPIINKVSISVSDEIKTYISDEIKAIKQWVLTTQNSIWNFIIISSNPHRFYPENNLASQVLWFVDSEWKGHYGIEWYFNDLLRWSDSEIYSKKDINGRIIDPISLEKQNLIWEGYEIYSTIDRNIQSKVEKILEKWVKSYNANRWSIIVMDPFSWAVKAMANYPSFNSNIPWNVYEIEKIAPFKYENPEIELLWKVVLVEDSERWEEFYYDSKKIFLRLATREELWDKALIKYKYKNNFWAWVYKNDIISSLYEPGSIMKAITVAIWLDTWEITRHSMYNDKWEVVIDDFTIRNDSDKCLWYHSFAHSLNYSCNVWMVRISQRYWEAIAYEYLNDFWFSESSWISLDWEVYKTIEPPEKWSKAKLFTSSYGLGINSTPLQMAAAYSVLANGWVYVKPRIVDYVKFSNWKKINYKKEILRRVITPETSKIVTSMLVDWARNGVAKNWNVVWYSVAWKTWTSQIAYKWKYEKWQWSTFASYAWYWPAEDPKFVIIVKLERPKVNIYWWQTSAYIFRETSEYLFDYYWIPRKK